ncbi:MAG: restriction endonuclease subunit S, partial [Oscillospiraceae bacterium]
LYNSSTKLLLKDDIIISARGTVGEVAMIPFPMAFNQSCYGIRGTGETNKTYLYYLIKNSVSKLKSLVHGSVFDTITKETFENIKIILPSLEEQLKISSVLSSVDDKIEINNKINNNLFEQAKVLFINWFTEFAPFSDNNTMPTDWRMGTIGEIIELHDSKRIPLSSSQRGKMDKNYPYYGATSLMDYVDNYLFNGIYLLLGEDGT